jgi:uncharacterized membrane protein
MVSTAAPPERHAWRRDEECVQLGLIVTPTLAIDAVGQLTEELSDVLRRRYPTVCWEVTAVRDSLTPAPVQLTELVDAARERLLAEDWELAVCVTDLPVRLERRPLVTHTSKTHGIALVSLPALGPLKVRQRLLEAIVGAVDVLVGDAPGVQRRLKELATEVDTGSGVAYLARVISGNLRLLLGMIRANRPWRLVVRLSRALLGALAAAVYTLVTSDVWRIATSLDAWRLAGLALAVIAAAACTLITAHGLWERTRDPRVREQVTLFNLTTLVTVVFGIVTLYAVVFLAGLAGALLLIDRDLLASAIQRPVGLWDYVRLAWLSSSLATVGGALGASLETDTAVREAAYGYRAGK